MDETTSPKPPVTVDEYIAAFPADVQRILQAVRATIRAAAPQAEEAISYGMPTFRLKGNLVHFGAHKTHIGFYPTPAAIEAFRERLAVYEGAKGSIRFLLDQPIPLDLIAEMTRFRVQQVMSKRP